MNKFKLGIGLLFAISYIFTSQITLAKTITPDEIRENTSIASSPATVVAPAAYAGIATLTIFADPTKSTVGSSWVNYDLGTHAFITIKNISTENITIGNLANIKPGKTITIGTWGNKTEHTGLWYNLEANFVSNNSAYKGRVSYATALNSTSLKTLNSYILSHDSWSNTTNCSSFASGAWNSVAATADKISAGTPNTPKNLANSIKTKWPKQYSSQYSVPYDYVVYYAQGSKTPVRSKTY
jgi:hypothetical protein